MANEFIKVARASEKGHELSKSHQISRFEPNEVASKIRRVVEPTVEVSLH